jgi:UDP-N-acetylmuramyl pentapeptide phosphotransferase/UDP-N-acetylglucosamine-1-phosphate transferase
MVSMFPAAIVTFVVAAVMTPLLAAWAHRRNLLDIPNHRSSHVIATPRIGGVALVSSVLTGVVVLNVVGAGIGRETTIVLAGAVGIALLGLIDDFVQLSPVLRLIVQAAVATGVVLTVGSAPLRWLSSESWVSSLLMVWWIGTLTNAYNFMDGIDGIAGAQALVAGIGWTAVAWLAGSPDIAALGLMLAGASGGFLLHNWHPAKVFMGDAGSGFFGFLFAALPLLAPDDDAPVFLLYATLLIWPFVFDTCFTLIRRASRAENILSAHRSHLYQRLVLTGRSHSQVTLVYAGLAVLGVVAAISVAASHPVVLLVSAIVMLVAWAGLWWNLVSREAAFDRPSSRTAV